ncbi:MAG: hypothetical protein KDI68_14575 [Gammaproteobacteria bacterium]|nr:hypothetical protein [Gammaproteobacteria bacterium]
MYSTSSVGSFATVLQDFQLDGMMMRYSRFVPRLYNFCLSLGMEPGKIMPSRAFCSDESQGFPIILIAKQFGTFPFNHGVVGGGVATDRHGPHASHGKDLVIIQASHVGYDPESDTFGVYRRNQTSDCHSSTNCGKLMAVTQWYIDAYRFACDNIVLEPPDEGGHLISINNLLLQGDRSEGLLLALDQLIAHDDTGNPILVRALSTARRFRASPLLIGRIGEQWPSDRAMPIGRLLTAELFTFRRNLPTDPLNHLEQNLINPMPWIVTDAAPALAAAQVNTQVEFDRTYRTISQEQGYQQRNLLFIAGLNIDISPRPDQIFPLTKFIPWAAYLQTADGGHRILEQQALYEALMSSDSENPNKIDLEEAIRVMEQSKEVSISFDFRH